MLALTGSRRGATLVELLVALVLLLPAWTAAMALVAAASREAGRTGRIAAAEAAIADAVAVLAAELADARSGIDLLWSDPTRIHLHAARGVGLACRADSSGFVVAASTWVASRIPVPGRDSVWFERVATDGSGWREALRAGLSAPPVAAPCPGGAPGLRIPADLRPAFLPGLVPGPLVRTTEVIELAAYASGGDTWLGLRHLGLPETIQPVAGPFRGNGLRFEGEDAAGQPAPGLTSVRRIRVILETPDPWGVRREVRLGLDG